MQTSSDASLKELASGGVRDIAVVVSWRHTRSSGSSRPGVPRRHRDEHFRASLEALLACAVRTLSTRIRSPACHCSRAVFGIEAC